MLVVEVWAGGVLVVEVCPDWLPLVAPPSLLVVVVTGVVGVCEALSPVVPVDGLDAGAGVVVVVVAVVVVVLEPPADPLD